MRDEQARQDRVLIRKRRGMGDRSDGSVRSLCTDVFDGPTGGGDLRDGVSIAVGRVPSPNRRATGAAALALVACAGAPAQPDESVPRAWARSTSRTGAPILPSCQ